VIATISSFTTTTKSTATTTIGTDPNTKPDYNSIVGPLGRYVDLFCMILFRNKLRDQVLMRDNENDAVNVNVNMNTNATISQQQQQRQPQFWIATDPRYYENNPFSTTITTTTTNANATTSASAAAATQGEYYYRQIVTLAAAMNARYQSQPQRIQSRAQNVLISLFPSWLPSWYKILFAQPFPIVSAQMNAHVTAALGVWLMGECTVNDILIPMSSNNYTNTNHQQQQQHNSSSTTSDTTSMSTTNNFMIGKQQGVLVTRCRFLEESQCASICVNSCKIPTQQFFLQQMGVPLVMEPNYTTGSCQFSFGRYPNVTTETVAKNTPCLSRCPTSGSYRQNHNAERFSNTYTDDTSVCSMMGDTSLLLQ
jgi:Beta-carotene isomerase D27-like, C-terminal